VFSRQNESRAATKPTIIPRHNKDPVVITKSPTRMPADVLSALAEPIHI
jgi:hypothetical protein